MAKRVPLRLLFTACLIICAAVPVLLDRPWQNLTGSAPAHPGLVLPAMPHHWEHMAVLSWMFEHRSDAAQLEFLDWSAPRRVSNNPFTDGPATLIEVVVKNQGPVDENREYLAFYLCNFKVLGSTSQLRARAHVVFCA